MNKFMKVKVTQSCLTLQPHGLYSPWNSPGKNTGVGCHFLFQGIFLTQGSNPGLLHYRQILQRLSHQGSLRVLEWVSYPFSKGSSWPRNWTWASCIAGRFFTSWATREAWQAAVCGVANSQTWLSDWAQQTKKQDKASTLHLVIVCHKSLVFCRFPLAFSPSNLLKKLLFLL